MTKGLGSSTPFPTVLYGGGGTGAYGAGGVQLSFISNPQWLFMTLFAHFMPSNTGAQAQTTSRASPWQEHARLRHWLAHEPAEPARDA